jgi:hypothetical protein
VRERWLGATGRKVPEIAVEGELDPETLRQAHRDGRPVAVRAETPQDVKAALARPEVSCVLVPREHRELLDLDLTALTYD